MAEELSGWVTRIEDARERIYELVDQTPVVLIEDDSEYFASREVYLKLEHLQKTGSFKLRGATNKILSLSEDEASLGVVTSSTGNHGLGVAAAAQHRGIEAEVYVSSQVADKKVKAIENYGAQIRQAGDTPLAAELEARSAAARSGKTYISPYNDPDVIAGQGTISSELLERMPKIDAVYVAVGGGGLIGGIGAYFKAISPATKIVGCWPENSRVMYECLHAGRIIEFPELPTLSQSTAGGVEPGSVTFELCEEVVDRGVLVSEEEILEAMRWSHTHDWPIEGAAAVAIASYKKEASRHKAQRVVIIACGGNLSPDVRALL